jgi:hypothetical protein
MRARFGLAPGPSAQPRAIERGLADIDPQLLNHRAALMRCLVRESPAPPSRGAARQQTSRRCRSVRRAGARPAGVLFIDDWHWPTTPPGWSRHRDLGNLPILLLVATRPPELGDVELTGADHLALAPFSAAEADTTIGEMLPAADPFVAAEIRHYSGGNPLFIEELCHAVARAGASAALDGARRFGGWRR